MNPAVKPRSRGRRRRSIVVVRHYIAAATVGRSVVPVVSQDTHHSLNLFSSFRPHRPPSPAARGGVTLPCSINNSHRHRATDVLPMPTDRATDADARNFSILSAAVKQPQIALPLTRSLADIMGTLHVMNRSFRK